MGDDSKSVGTSVLICHVISDFFVETISTHWGRDQMEYDVSNKYIVHSL